MTVRTLILEKVTDNDAKRTSPAYNILIILLYLYITHKSIIKGVLAHFFSIFLWDLICVSLSDKISVPKRRNL